MFDTHKIRIIGLPCGEETMIPGCDGQMTDRRTDGQNCYINIARSVLTRDKNILLHCACASRINASCIKRQWRRRFGDTWTYFHLQLSVILRLLSRYALHHRLSTAQTGCWPCLQTSRKQVGNGVPQTIRTVLHFPPVRKCRRHAGRIAVRCVALWNP